MDSQEATLEHAPGIVASEKPLIYWAVERERIRLKKEAGLPPPWTEDRILRQYRFCNVRRRDDKVSRWLCDRVLQEFHIETNLRNFLLFSAFCRWVNWPPTINAILDEGMFKIGRPMDWTAIGSRVDELQRTGVKAWTGAYMVRAKPGDGDRGKGRFVAEDVIEKSLTPVLDRLVMEVKEPHRSRQVVWETLEGCLNWGSFMAGQVVADWGYTSLLKDAYDTNTWAPMGPGSKRGLNRLLGRPVKHKITQMEWESLLPALHIDLLAALGPGYEDLTLHDVQNCLCEVDKYLRVQYGEGRPRATYKSETSF